MKAARFYERFGLVELQFLQRVPFVPQGDTDLSLAYSSIRLEGKPGIQDSGTEGSV